ncbi:MAG: glycosyltransferase family 1 protein [Lachnospiraceae bacterium]|nr:glycosyltransferase family 1 protein [Lachnospiraceae bacterium]
MAHIVLFTQWTGGDVYPFLRYGKLLREIGHRVTVLTHCVYEDKAKELGLEFHAIDTPEEYENINRDLHMLSDPIGNREDFLRFYATYHGKARLLREVRLIEQVTSDESIVIARYRSGIAGQLAAEKNHLRYASMILAPNYFSHMELHDQMFGAEFLKDINGTREELGLQPVENWKDWLYSPKTILCGWPEWYAQRDETWPEGATPIGFLEDRKDAETADIPAESLATGDEIGRKHVLITGGSSRMVSSDFYKTAVEAVAKTDAVGYLVTPYKEYVPQPLPKNIHWITSIPLRKLMRVSDLIIHHGGMGTINEAIDSALPQIIMPHLTDGPDNADRLVKMGVAVKFAPKNWDAEKIAEASKRVLADETKSVCVAYQKKNQADYRSNLWARVINRLGFFEMRERSAENGATAETFSAAAGNAKARMLELLKKKRLATQHH